MLQQLKPWIDRGTGTVRGTTRTLERLGRRAASEANGVVERVRHRNPEPKPDMDDVTLARKVETVLFRDGKVPKGKIDVNVADGVVYLHGEAKNPAQMKKIESTVRSVPEVRDVENLLHLPKTPATTRADAPGRPRKTGTRKEGAAQRGGGERFSAERTPEQAEESPADLAAKGAGRQASPLGSTGEEPTEGDGPAKAGS